MANSEIIPLGEMFAMREREDSTNQTFRSEPRTMLRGPLDAVGSENSVIAPAGVILAITFDVDSAAHILPSAPSTSESISGVSAGVLSWYSAIRGAFCVELDDGVGVGLGDGVGVGLGEGVGVGLGDAVAALAGGVVPVPLDAARILKPAERSRSAWRIASTISDDQI